MEERETIERVTKVIQANTVLYVGKHKRYDTGDTTGEINAAGIRDLLHRLADYEDTGLTPAQIAAQNYSEQPLTMAELRKMDGQAVYCLELNTEVRVSARKTGWIEVHWPVPVEKECCKAHGLTLYRTKPAEVLE